MDDTKLLVDTSVIIDYFRKTNKEKTLFYDLVSTNDLSISAVTEYELYVGAKTRESRSFLDNLLQYISVLAFDSSTAKTAVEIYQKLKSKNELIGIHDIFIAATALRNNLTLVTLDQNHFNRVEKLRLFINS